MNFRRPYLFVTMFLAIILSACGTTTTDVKSDKVATYHQQPKRLLIAGYLGVGFHPPISKNPAEWLHDRLIKAFAACGVTADFVELTSLTVDDPIVSRAPQFLPDAIITEQVSDEVVNRGSFISANYHFEMKDAATRSVVWKAKMHLESGAPHVGTYDTVVDGYIKALIDRMKLDNLLPATCAAS